MKIRSRDRRATNRRGSTIGRVERLEGRQLLATMAEYAIPSNTPRPTDIASGPDGNLWFAETNTDKIGRITPTGTITEFSLPAGSGPDYITKGPDDNLWFTEPGTNSIGMITTAGVVTQYPVPTETNLGLGGITPGPDGELWFTESTTDSIGEISTSGAMSFHTDGQINSPYEIVEGHDGNMWFTEYSDDKIGEFVLSGPQANTVQVYSLSSGAGPRGITAGPDGNLWFTEGGLGQIGRITTSGAVSEFAIPTSGSNPVEISNGPGGDLYFADDGGNDIGQINTSGVVTNAFAIPTSNSDPDGMTMGPDGKVWFTEFLGDQIGTLATISPTSLSVAEVSGTYGGTAEFQATLSSNGSPVANEPVDFELGTKDLGAVMTNSEGVATIAAGALGSLHAGTYSGDVTASFVGDSNYQTSGGASDLTVNPAPLTITADNQTMVYGSTVPIFTATYTGLVNGDAKGGQGLATSITSGVSSTSDVGTYTISVSGASDPDYTITRVAGQVAVTPAPLTVSVQAASKVYGQANPTPVVTVSGILNGDDVSASYTDPAGQYSDASLLGYTVSFDGLTGPKMGDYSTTVQGGSASPGLLTITPAPLTIVIDAQSKVYGQANPTPVASISGILNGDDVSASDTDPAGQYSDVQAGGYDISLASLIGSKAEDYSTTVAGGSVSDGTLIITPAPLTVEVADQSKVYGQANPAATGLFGGTLDGDQIGLTYAAQAQQFSGVTPGGYPITPTGVTGPKGEDYSYTAAGSTVSDGTLTITPAPLAVVVRDASRTYGQANLGFSGTVGGILGDDDVVATYATTADSTSDAGSYQIAVTGLTGAQAGDYALTNPVSGTLTITPAPLTITAVNQTRTYGQANPTFTATYSGFVLEQDPSVLGGTLGYRTPATQSTDFGIYPVQPGGLTSTDYAITYVTGGIAITPAALTVTAVNQTRTYGQANPTFTATYSGFVLGQDPSVLGGGLNFTTPATQLSHFGIDPVSVGGLTSPTRDYIITFVGGGIAITPAPLTITAPSFFKVYGQAVPSLSATYSGFVNGDSAASLITPAIVTTPETSASHVGFYPVVASGATSLDYAITENYGISDVFRAILVATPGSGFVAYGQPLPNFGITYSGFVNGDTTASLTSQATISSPESAGSLPGFYPVIANGGIAANYVVLDGYGIADVLTPSPAALGSDPGLSAFVASLYQDLLGRAPEPGGLGVWVNQLNQGISQSSVAEQIYGSPEATNYRATHPNQAASLGVAYYDAVVSQERVDQG